MIQQPSYLRATAQESASLPPAIESIVRELSGTEDRNPRAVASIVANAKVSQNDLLPWANVRPSRSR